MSEQTAGRPDERAGRRRPSPTQGDAAGKGGEQPGGGTRAATVGDAAERERRLPQRAPGRRRVDAILDASSAILLEEGLAGLSMDAVVKRSGTSKSSMYHFFCDIGDVLDALLERHIARMSRVDQEILDQATPWESLSLEETVDRFLEPFVSYLDQHPDLLLVIREVSRSGREGPCGSAVELLAIDRADQIVAARSPGVQPAERRTRATMMFAMFIGVMEVSKRITEPPRPVLLGELKRALLAYLTAEEARDATG